MMNNMIVKNNNGEQLSINVVRYFRLNGIEYLIFSLNEIDDGGYVKLYISKVMGQMANTIDDDVEWSMIKDTIKTIIKSNKENLPLPITDLSLKRINNLQITDQKVFKLNDSLLQLLSANKKEELTPDIDVKEIQSFDQSQEPVEKDSSIFTPIEQTADNNNPIEEINRLVQTNELDNSLSSNSAPLTNDYMVFNTNLPNHDGLSDYGLDYKKLYENEQIKNKELLEENNEYKQIIEQLRKILDKTL